MKKKADKEIWDIEDLLLSKSYDSLSKEERAFVRKEIASGKEYEELRNTLLSVKKWAKEETQIEPQDEVKTILMKQMEASSVKSSFWDKLGVFLFPTDVPMVKKPGFQLAVMGVVLLFVINVGLNQLGTRQNELALNSKTMAKPAEMPQPVELSNEKLPKEESIQPKSKNAVPLTIVETEQREEVAEDEIVEELFFYDSEPEPQALKEEEIAKPQFDNYTEAVRLEPNEMRVLNKSVASLSQVTETKRKKVKNTTNSSQNLAGQEQVIDLLFTAL
jgi:hypothetical protein